MATFDGVPTFVGGHGTTIEDAISNVYQYDYKEDQWVGKSDEFIGGAPRFTHGMIQIPIDLFGICWNQIADQIGQSHFVTWSQKYGHKIF